MTKQCDNCEAWVSHDYWRVFSVDGTLHACPSCYAELDKTLKTVFTP